MANFWNLSDGNKPEQKTSFDASGGEPIPDNTDALAIIEEAGWKAGFEGAEDLIQLRWSILKPEAFKGRKVFQKLKVGDPESKVSDKAKRMLMAIDTNAGGKLSKLDSEPDDNVLMGALMNKPMVIKIKVWEMNDRSGNWVAAVSSAKKAAAPASEPVQTPAPAPAIDDDLDSIPF
jgi:hypothetical protein